jgi:hypothetical protein
MSFRRTLLGIAAVLVILTGAAQAGFLPSPAGQTIDVATRPGVTERYLLWRTDEAPKAILLMFIGSQGVAAIRDKTGPTWSERGNFLPRAREYFRRRGFAVAEVDTPSDHRDGLIAGFRLSADHAADAAAVMADLRRRVPGVPLWLIGTSRGSISAASVAARLQGAQAADGVVLTSSVTEPEEGLRAPSRDSVMDVDLSAIRIPVLITFHRQDTCVAVSTRAGPSLQRKLANAPKSDVLLFEGGDPPQSGPCEALAAHGYFGIEERVANAIADWILAAKT